MGQGQNDFGYNLINRLCFHLGGWLDKGIWVKVWKKLRYYNFHGKSSWKQIEIELRLYKCDIHRCY